MPDSLSDDGYTLVYFPKPFVESKGYNEHVFDVPFCWDGVSNFIVDICVQNQPQDKSYNCTINSGIPDSTRNTSYHDWNDSGTSICLYSERVQQKLYTKRPLSYFAAIPADSTDLKMNKIYSPNDLVDAGGVHEVKIQFQNYSCPIVSGVKLGYKFNSNPPVIENYMPSLVDGEFVDYTFSSKLNLPIAEFGILKVWVQHPDDQYRKNDTITYLVFVKDEKFTGLDYAGDDFWIAFMQNYANDNINQRVFITSTHNTSATVAVPLLGWDTTVTVRANTVVSVAVPLVINGVVTATEPSEAVSPTGVHVTSPKEISVYGYSGVALSTDAYLAVPRRTLGRKYTAYAPEGIYNPVITPPLLINAPAEFIVVGTEDSTKVEIIPSAPTEKHNKGDTIRVTLNRGQTFLVKAAVGQDGLFGLYNTTYDLTGSKVSANFKVGMIGGSSCAYIPGITRADKCQSCDHLLEMQTAPHTWGKEFYITDFEFKTGDDIVRLINGDSLPANIEFNGLMYQIPANDYLDVKFQGNAYVKSDRPIQALQMCTGGMCTIPSSPTDPFISNMVPQVQWGNYYTFATPTTADLSIHYINIVKKSKEARVGFDGVLLNPNLFSQIPGTDYYATKFGVSIGVHRVSGDSTLFVNVYGFGRDNSYGYPASGSLLKVINIPPPVITGIPEDVKCFRAKNGKISVDATEGTPPYFYYWNDGAVGAVRTGLDTGHYWCFVEDDYGYRDTAWFVIKEPDSLNIKLSKKDVICNAAKNGELHAVVSGGNPPYSTAWSDGPSALNRTNVSPGHYTFTLTDSLGCKKTDTITVIEPLPLQLNFNILSPSCNNGNDGRVRAIVQNGVPPLTYKWTAYPLIPADSIYNLKPGSYGITVTDSNGCKIGGTASVSNPAKITTTLTPTNIACFETATGKVNATASGGSGSFTFTWNTTPAQTQSTISNLNKGWYKVVADDGRCKATDSAFVDSVKSPVFIVDPATAICDKPNGSAVVTASGGSGTYTYKYSTTPAQTTKTASNLSPGNYTVLVSDGACSRTLPFQISNIPGPSFKVITTNLSCNLNNGSARLDSLKTTGNFTINWYTSPIRKNVQKIDSVKAGTFTVEVQDSVCAISKTFQLIKTPEPKITSITKVEPDCSKNNGSITVATSGGAGPLTISWNTTPVRYGPMIDSLSPGSYKATITDGVCTTNTAASLSAKGAPKIFLKIIQPKCDEANGRIIASVMGGTGTYSYIWNGDSTLNNDTISNIPAGSYSVVVDDGHCKSGSDTTLNGSPKPLISLNSYNPSCGKNNGAVKANVSAATNTLTHYWNGVQSNSDSLSGLNAGQYQYSVFDGTCWAYDSTVLIASAPLLANILKVDSSHCGLATGKASVAVSGGDGVYQITWRTNPPQYGDTAINLSKGSYTVYYTDFKCEDSLVVTVPERIRPAMTGASLPEHCDLNDGSMQITPTSGNPPFSITWFEPIVGGFSPTGLDSGWHKFTLSDLYCSIVDSGHVGYIQAPVIVLDSVTPAHCGLNNGTAYTHHTGPGTFSVVWNSPTPQTGNIATGLGKGIWRAIVSNQYCSDTVFAPIDTIPLLHVASLSTEPATCELPNAKIWLKASGGQGAYHYSWPSIPGNSSDSAVNLNGGWVRYTVTDDFCTIIDSTPISTISKPTVGTISSTPEWCKQQNGTATVVVSGGTGSYTYQWIGLPDQTSNTITGRTAGSYQVQITDLKCTLLIPVDIAPGFAPKGQVQVIKDEACSKSNGSARIVSLDPPDASINWNNSGQSGMTYSNLPKGSYTLKLSHHGCDTILNFSIGEVPALGLNVSSLDDTCNSGRGRIVWSAYGGQSPYNYRFNSGNIQSNSKSGLNQGYYSVQVSDANQCTHSVQIQLSNTDLIMPGGLITVDPLDPVPGDQMVFKNSLPAGWSQIQWYIYGSPMGNAPELGYVSTPVEQTIPVSLHTRHYTGCLDSIHAYISISEQYYIYIPSSFTPDADGYNEVFFPVTVGIKDIQGWIFDRWGEVIFTFNSLEDKWDGTYLGQPVKTDMYVFRMKFTTNKGDQVEHFGKVTLLR